MGTYHTTFPNIYFTFFSFVQSVSLLSLLFRVRFCVLPLVIRFYLFSFNIRSDPFATPDFSLIALLFFLFSKLANNFHYSLYQLLEKEFLLWFHLNKLD